MSVWTVLDLTDQRCPPRLLAELRDVSDGVVAIDPTGSTADPPNGLQPVGTARWDPVRMGSLADAVLALGDDVEVVVIASADCLQTFGVQLVADMLDELGDLDAAVVRGQPVTDALKRVEGDRLVESVDRSSLVAASTPQVIRRDALLAECVAQPLLSGHDTPRALLRGGHRVRVVMGMPAHHHATARQSAAG